MKSLNVFVAILILVVSATSHAEERKSFLDNFVDRVINTVEPDANQDSRDITKKALRWTITGKDEDWNALDTKIRQVYGNAGTNPEGVSSSEINSILSDGNLSKEQKRVHLKKAYKAKKVIGDLVVYDIGPSIIHKCSNTIVTYYVKNNSNAVLKNIQIETENIKSRVYDDTLGENDDYKENIILAPRDEAILQTIIKSDIQKSLGQYSLDYYFQYTYETGNQTKTPIRKFEFELVQPNEDIVFTAIDPNEIHQGSNSLISWLVKNNGSTPYKNVVIETDQIKRKIYGEDLGENDDFKENLVLASNDEALLQTIIKADIAKPQGEYGLKYHLELVDESGNWYRTPDYKLDFQLVEPNEDLRFLSISPNNIKRGTKTKLSYEVKNTGQITYRNIVIETDNIKRKIYGEELGENDDYKENFIIGVNDSALFQTIIKARQDKPVGEYKLLYHLEFTDAEGNWFRTPDYKYEFLLE